MHAYGPNTAVRTHVNVCMQTACNCMHATHKYFCKGMDQSLNRYSTLHLYCIVSFVWDDIRGKGNVCHGSTCHAIRGIAIGEGV